MHRRSTPLADRLRKFAFHLVLFQAGGFFVRERPVSPLSIDLWIDGVDQTAQPQEEVVHDRDATITNVCFPPIADKQLFHIGISV